MISFFIKHIRLVLDCLLVIAIILAFTFWDPFHILSKAHLKETASVVTGIRDIGQLTTAEFYGEVISSWKEFKLNEYPEDTLSEYAEEIYLDLKNTLSETKKDKQIDEKITGLKKEKIYDSEIYNMLILFLGQDFYNIRIEPALKDRNKAQGKIERKVLQRFWHEVKNQQRSIEKKYKDDKDLMADIWSQWLDSIPPSLDNFFGFYSMASQKKLKLGNAKNKNIVFIGRGWVKAGFDFGKLDESNFLYDKENKIVHFYGLEPVVLNADINPWFIPERKVKGFELVDYSGKVNFKDAKEVKKKCKEKLLAQAGQAQILQRALENGELALQSFFSLVLDVPDLKIEFHQQPYSLEYALFAADTLIDLNEALLIDSIYRNELTKISIEPSKVVQQQNTSQLTNFIERLKKLPFVEAGNSFSYFSLAAAQILNDTFHLAATDFILLLQLRDTLQLSISDKKVITTRTVKENPCWFSTGNFIVDFNQTLNLIQSEVLSTEGDTNVNKSDKKLSFANNAWKYNQRAIIIKDTVAGLGTNTTLYFAYEADLVKRVLVASDLKYNEEYPKLAANREIKDSAQYTILLRKNSSTKPFNPGLSQLAIEEDKILLQSLKNNYLYTKNVSPIKSAIGQVNNILDRFEKN